MLENIKKLSINSFVNSKDILIALVAAFGIAISSQIAIPLPNGVPMTLQTFSVALLGYSLSRNLGVKGVITYLIIGAIGIPVFAQAKGGIASLFGLTGGFLFGFIFLAYFCSKATKCNNFIGQIAFSFIGLLLCHLLGVLQYGILTGVGFINSAVLVSVPFLVKDLVSIAFAFVTCKGITLLKNKV